MYKKQWFVITYDIADPKRLVKVFKYLKQFALHEQRSVFTAHLTEKQKKHTARRLRSMIDEREDTVWICPARSANDIWLNDTGNNAPFIKKISNFLLRYLS
ncbi:CRISPR-associated endonuclease Cas2 [Marinifilum sp. JC120]|nr:CRISPR-associated endonuclease Cas2 [Marinifilum sp. JC120]